MASIVFDFVGVKTTKWRRVKRESVRNRIETKPKTEIGNREKCVEIWLCAWEGNLRVRSAMMC